MITSICLPVGDSSQAGEARRRVVTWAREQGCAADDTEQLALTVAELARNLGLHTSNGGELLVRLLSKESCLFEILSLDRGPGMRNFATCLDDGFSTAGTAGTGLGAVFRASQLFDVHTAPGVGTALMSRVGPHETREKGKDGLGVINVPKHDQDVCGDTCAFVTMEGGRVRVMIADGLGHGPIAAEASLRAGEVFESGKGSLTEVLGDMHLALRATRGAAVSIAEVDPAQERVLFAGVGNVAGTILSHEKTTHMVSMNGTVGATFPRVREFSYPWSADSLLVMNSDGLKTQWRLDGYSGLMGKHPALAAGILYRDFSRGQDDSTVATLKLPYEHRT
jgi:anti-sigma regulatory factor (Ser/Thr protein kinase)